jgi:hypothetical protein
VTTTATFINYQTVVCYLPIPGSFHIGISNNGGLNISQGFDLLTFDPECVTCTSPSDCTIQVCAVQNYKNKKKIIFFFYSHAVAMCIELYSTLFSAILFILYFSGFF